MTGELDETSGGARMAVQNAPSSAGQSSQARGTVSSPLADASAAHDQRRGVASKSFLGLLATQLLGATNDNAFRLLAIGICEPLVRKHRPELSFAIIPIEIGRASCRES